MSGHWRYGPWGLLFLWFCCVPPATTEPPQPTEPNEFLQDASLHVEPSFREASAPEPPIPRQDKQPPEPPPQEKPTSGEQRPDLTTPPLPVKRLDLLRWVADWDYGSEGRARFQPLSATQEASFRLMIRAFLKGEQVQTQALAAAFGMALVEVEDRAGGRYWLLSESASVGVGLGLYLRPLRPLRKLVLEAPHPIKDASTNTQGVLLLRALQPQLLMIASLQRCEAKLASQCDGSTSLCGGMYRISDVAHEVRAAFHLAHQEAVSATSSTFVQLHGFARKSGEPSAFVSNGTKIAASSGDISLRVRDAINQALQGTNLAKAQSCNDPKDNQVRLCGTTNVQGRLSNGVAKACFQSATKAGGRFVHIEQRRSLREGTPGVSVLQKALEALFPAE